MPRRAASSTSTSRTSTDRGPGARPRGTAASIARQRDLRADVVRRPADRERQRPALVDEGIRDVGEEPRRGPFARLPAVADDDARGARRARRGWDEEDEVDPLALVQRRRLEAGEVLVRASRRAADARRRIALRVAGGEVGVVPAAADELLVREAAGRLVEVARDERRSRDVVRVLDEAGDLHRLALAHVRRARRHALGGAVGRAWHLGAVGAGGEVRRVDVERAFGVRDPHLQHAPEAAVEELLALRDDGIAREHRLVVDVQEPLALHELVRKRAHRRDSRPHEVDRGRPYLLQRDDVRAAAQRDEVEEERDAIGQPAVVGVVGAEEAVQEVQVGGRHVGLRGARRRVGAGGGERAHGREPGGQPPSGGAHARRVRRGRPSSQSERDCARASCRGPIDAGRAAVRRHGTEDDVSHPRAEIEAAIERFIAANRRAEETGDWTILADFYTDDAVYTYQGLAAGGWVEARGRDEIRRQILERDMAPYGGWTFPYDWYAIDGDRVVTRWWNRAPGSRADGSPIQAPGMSVLEYAGDGRFRSQFDLFDRLSVKAVAEEAARKL